MENEKYIFPREVIENTAEFHFHVHNSYTRVIYRAVLLALFAAVLALFFIRVDVNVKSAGLFRPVNERNEIKPLVSGRVDSLFVRENSYVKAGQVLLTIRREILDEQNSLVQLEQDELQKQVADLEQLISAYKRNDWSKRLKLESGIYGQQYSLFMQRITEARARYALAAKNNERYRFLLQRQAVSVAEYDQIRLQMENVRNELGLIGEEQGSRWQSDLNRLRSQNRQLTTQGETFKEEKDFYTLRAPVSGNVQQLKGIQPGSVVSVNELLGEISPDSGLIAETYVLPKDIGLLKVGTRARFQIDAYNYNQWGMVGGKVVSISNDIFMDKTQPYFKVRCQLDKNQLQLKNGYTGRIKKGMTLQARFFVTRRTLFQLLYDKADDWLNPNVIADKKEQTAGL
ncbi:HlyD family secretion protein [Pedobacter sp. SYP-B3415]|uniref:HlyD family secretion protein n=1 Tax=Pedobacter sp. SYP-B3415 TaxID=2496641 RepID=UPI00101DBB25|nr:HlyD family efflux transporter periplasmic adaptor subunit [Pedobacter sp. SYP-B3415]